MVRSLVLAEPPLLAWVRDFPEGARLYDDFMERIQDPAREAFAAGNDEAAMRLFVDGFANARAIRRTAGGSAGGVMQNAGFFRMMSRSENPYPEIDRRALWSLRMPVLVITGEKTIEIHRRIDEELAQVHSACAIGDEYRRRGMGAAARESAGVHRSGQNSGDSGR